MNDPTQKNIKKEKAPEDTLKPKLIKPHKKRESNRATIGDKLYISLLEWRGVRDCFVKSLKASNKGWTRPIKETLLGPKRIWKRPITLRSNKVKKATDKSTRRTWTIQEIIKNIKERKNNYIISFED